MALVLIPWVCLSLIICLAFMRAAARPVRQPKPLSASATPDPFKGYIASVAKVDLERECMAARDVPFDSEGRRNPDLPKPVHAERISWDVLAAEENPAGRTRAVKIFVRERW